MIILKNVFILAALAGVLALHAQPAGARVIQFRNFTTAAAMGPPANEYGVKLDEVTRTALGRGRNVSFVPLPGVPPIPRQFGDDIVAAVGAGAAGGGFDAAYNSASQLNETWGFLVNSGTPFGVTWDEFLGFLYGRSRAGQTGLELVQEIMDRNRRNVVVFPIVGNAEQLSGYFLEPIGDVDGQRGIGLEGFCQRDWTLRYLPPAENVFTFACDALVASGEIPANNLKFVAPIPGGGSLVDAVKAGLLDGFEFATPLDDVSTQFNTADNPGTVGVRYVHTPGWHQQWLVTWMVVNKDVWNALTKAQQVLALTVARDHVVSTYGENLGQQGPALDYILKANKDDGNPENDMVLVEWPRRDQARLRDATIRFLNARARDPSLPQGDRADYAIVLETMRAYVYANDFWWDRRQVPTRQRFVGWKNKSPWGR